jgi:hypothetical protein
MILHRFYLGLKRILYNFIILPKKGAPDDMPVPKLKK